MEKKAQFSSQIGLIAATVGSAVGLGNIWRFPAEVQTGGGASFLLIYIACVLLLGIPVMLAEFALGRAGGSDAAGSFINLGARRWQGTGWIAIAASFLILGFYIVVGGWTLEYMVQSLTGNLYADTAGIESMHTHFDLRMQEYIATDTLPLIYTYIVLAISAIVLLCGVQKGIERMSNILMPMLFVLLIVFCCFSLTLPKAAEGLTYFFRPDFSKVGPSTVLSALGQAFFSLSLGMGVLITYASYFKPDAKLVPTAFTVSLLDMLVSVLMGIIIFPAVVSFSLQGEGTAGSTLVFITLPEVFASMPAPSLWSTLFFLLLFIAALTSIVSVAEVSARALIDRLKVSRPRACLYVFMPLVALATLCSLSMGTLSGFTIAGLNIFDLLDTVTAQYMLTTAALLTSIYIGWFAPRGLFIGQLTNHGRLRPSGAHIFLFINRWIAPLLIIAVIISNFL